MSLPTNTATWTQANYQSATAANIAALSVAQVAALQHPDWLSPAAVAGFSAAQVAAISISWSYMNAAWVNALSVAAFAGIPVAGIAQLSGSTLAGLNAAHIVALTAKQIGALSTAQLGALSAVQIGDLNALQVEALTVAQFGSLSTSQLAGLSAAAAAGLSNAQLTALGLHLRALSPAAIGGLAATTVAHLSGWQLALLTETQLAALTASQVAVLTAAQVADLSQGQLVALGARVQSLTAAALDALGTGNLLAIYRQLGKAQIAALPSAQAAAVALAVKDTTSLQTSLSTAGLQNEVKTVVGGGTSLFGYQGVLDVLEALGGQIGATGLTTAQLADLKAFTKVVGAVDGSGSYIFGVLNDVVNGNPFNATWTDGAATSSALGNLAAGSSQSQFDELVGKWLLGGDNPAWNAGTATTLTATPAALFGTGGVTAADPSQGGIGDCYLIAAMVEVALDQPGLIQSMFTDNGNGTYGVRFYAPDGAATYVTVSDSLASGQRTAGTVSGGQWVTLLEKAFVEYSAEFDGNTNAWSAIAGGWDEGLTAITGKSDMSYISAYSGSQSAWDGSVDKAVIAALSAGEEVLYGSFIDDTGSNGKTDLVSDHMFAVIGYDKSTGDFILRNPWGAAGGSSWNGQFEQSIDQLWGGTSGTASDSGFIVAEGASPAGAGGAVSAAAQLAQALAGSGGGNGGSVVNLASASLVPPAVGATLAVAHA